MFYIKYLLILLNCTSAFARPSTQWPMGEWPRRSLKDAGFRDERFSQFVRFAYNAPGGFSTDSIVVIKDGHLVFEKHENGYKPHQKHALWSMTKTLQNAMVGILEFKGLMHRDAPLHNYYSAIRTARNYKNVTIRQLLNMSSGLDWVEEHKEDLFKSDPMKFYNRIAFGDMAGFVAQRAFVREPGANFSYSTGDATLLARAIRGAIGEKDYYEFPWRELFDKLGMHDVAVERDPSGLLGFQGLAHISPHDLAKLGLFYLNGGVVNGRPMLPADWLQFTSTMAPAQNHPPDPTDLNRQNDQAFGAHIWLNKRRPYDSQLPYPDLPEDTLLALGMRGQFLLIFPRDNVVLVRTASDTEFMSSARKYYRKELFRLFYSTFRKEN